MVAERIEKERVKHKAGQKEERQDKIGREIERVERENNHYNVNAHPSGNGEYRRKDYGEEQGEKEKESPKYVNHFDLL